MVLRHREPQRLPKLAVSYLMTLVLLLALAGCRDEPARAKGPSCDEWVTHVATLQADATAAKNAHHGDRARALLAGAKPTLRRQCQALADSQVACGLQAASAEELAQCHEQSGEKP